MDHYIETGEEKNRNKIQSHLAKFIDVYSPAWVQTNGLFQKLRFDKFRGKVKGYRITTLILTNNMHPTIIKDIGGGNFQYLLVLNLSNNCIRSVEQLQSFDAPCLEALILDRNLLINLKALRKWVVRGLKILDVSMNHINDISHINLFSCHAIKHLNLSYNDIPILNPYAKAMMNPPLLTLNRMKLIGPVGKKEYIDTCLRRPLDSGLPRTKI